ncbi:hypothetical protein [Vacuolonema iberomarrocanum]|uniref:hypothetical protein n=1 Tax=Vacuolonema iberomarrocanum TaxID=3454632 RepID=UPI003F6E3B06
MTQVTLVEKLYSSQPRIAKVENGDASVSVEQLTRTMLAAVTTPQEIGKAIAQVS